jgi:hypothetical protein
MPLTHARCVPTQVRFGLNRADVMSPEDVVQRHTNVLYAFFLLAIEAHRRGHPG